MWHGDVSIFFPDLPALLKVQCQQFQLVVVVEA